MKAPNFLEPKQRKTFRDKYPAVIFAVAALLFCSTLSAQSDSTKYSQINGYGFKYKRWVGDSIIMIPLSTSPHTPYRPGGIRYRASDSTIQVWTGNQWNSIVTGVGNGVDTAYMVNDTVLVIETPDQNFMLQVGKRHVDTLYRKVGQDSIFYRIAGVERAILDSAGSSPDSTIFSTNYRRDTAVANLRDEIGAVTLQTVTDAGATTSNKMAYTTLPYFLISDSAKIPNKKYVDTRQESYLGAIYNANSWTNLNDFTQTGGIGAAVNSNKIDISGGSGTFVKTLDLNWYTMLERWKCTVRFKITSAPSGTSYGIGVGIHSTNGYGAVNALGRIDLTSGGSGGQLFLNGHTDNSQLAASATNLAIANNDTIVLTVERKVDSIIVYATNITQSNAKVRVGYKYDITSSMTKQLPNTGRFAVFAFGGTQTIDSISITSGEIKNATLLTIGDSKTQAYYADNFNSRYSIQLDDVYQSTVLHAGGYDRTTEWITYLPELKALNPKQVILTNPSNDARSGISSGTSQAQYDQVVDSLTSWGIDVFHALSFYETSQDNSAWNTYINATYSADKIIDTWSPTRNCTGCVSGDGIHLTEKGNDTVFYAIKNSYKILRGGTNRVAGSSSFSGTDNTIAMFSGGTLVNSFVYQDANRVYMSKGFESTGTDPGFDVYKTNAGTDEKGWNFYNDATNMYIATFNDARNSVYNAMKFNRTGNSVNYIAAPQHFVVGTSTDPGTYMQSIVTTTAPILRLRTSNSTGGYIGFDNASATKGYIGYGSSLTTGASNNDITIRSQNDTIHFSNNLGTSMAKIAAGKLYVTAHAIGSNSDSALIWDRATNEYKVAAINTGGDGIYGGNGSLPSDVTVTGGNNSLTLNDIFAFKVNSDYNVIAKADGSGTYTEAILGAANEYWLGYTPTVAVYSKGGAVIIDTNNRVGVGTSAPTAVLHLKAGTASANTAPLKFSSGTNLATPEAGAVEFDGTNYFATTGSTRYKLSRTLEGSTTHDFGTIANNSSATTTVSVTGAADGDFVLVTKPISNGWSNGESYTAWVSAADQVTVRQNNNSGGSAGFGSQTINVKVIKQ